MKGCDTSTRAFADKYSLDHIHGEKHNVPSREPFAEKELSTQSPEGARRGTQRQSSLHIWRRYTPASPHLLGRHAPASRLQTQAERGSNRENSRDPRVRDSQPVSNGMLEEKTSQVSPLGHGQNRDASFQVHRGFENEIIRNQEASIRENVQPHTQHQPPLSEYLEDDDEASDAAPAETSDQRRTERDVQVEMRSVNGELQFFAGGKWRTTILLQTIRAEILAQEKLKGAYIYEWAKGRGGDDETSYHPWYATWGWERNQRPAILFQFNRNGYRAPSRRPEIWIYQGRVVLDIDKTPIELWPELPLLCSSNMSGAELEAISRTNPDMPLTAIRARMPQTMKTGTLHDPPNLNVLRMRMGRFRKKAGLIAWNEREGSRQIKRELIRILGPRCVRENSTWSFGRDLTKAEIERVEAVNKGSAPQRSRKKRPAESENESLDTPSAKRQNTSSGPPPEELTAEHTQASRFSMKFEEQASARQRGAFSPESRSQKRHRDLPVSDKAEDILGFPPTKRLCASPDYDRREPQKRRIYDDAGHNFDVKSPSESQRLPPRNAEIYKRRRDQRWAEENLNSDQGKFNPPLWQAQAGSSHGYGEPRRQSRYTQSDQDLNAVPSSVFSSFPSRHAQEQNQQRRCQQEEEIPDTNSYVGESPSEQRPYTGPRYNYGAPNFRRTHGGSSHHLDESSPCGISSLPASHIPNHKREREGRLANMDLRAETGDGDLRPSVKQPDWNKAPPRLNHGRESGTTGLWRSSQSRNRVSPHSVHTVDDDIQFMRSHVRSHSTQPRTMVPPSLRQAPYIDSMSAAQQHLAPINSRYQEQNIGPYQPHTRNFDSLFDKDVSPFETNKPGHPFPVQGPQRR